MDERIEDYLVAPPLRMRYLAGRGDTLVLSLSGVGTRRRFEPPLEFVGIASDDGSNHVLFVTDQSRCWLNSPDMAERIVAATRQKAQEIGATRIVALGNSMGGTMALHLSRLMAFDAVVALTPQYSVDPAVMPQLETWAYFRDQIAEFRFPRVEQLRPGRTQYFIVHGGDPPELDHALKFPAPRGVAHFILPDRDHRLAKDLKKSGDLAHLVRLGLAGRGGAFRRRIEALGGLFRSSFEAQRGSGAP